jgi:hypothetical protein
VGGPRREDAIPAVREERLPGLLAAPLSPEGRVNDCGEDGVSPSGILGDPESEPALKGWNDIDGRRPPASTFRREGRPVPRIGKE